MGDNSLSLTALVLKADPVGEADKRVVLLTAEKGKIAVFAKGARRPGSRLLAATNPFCFGEYTVRCGRSSNYLNAAEVSNYFEQLRDSYEAAVYGIYLLELADYYTRENNDEKQMLRLLYQSLKALCHPAYEKALVRYIYEIKALVLGGEYPGPPDTVSVPSIDGETYPVGAVVNRPPLDATIAALAHIAEADLEKLYTFAVSPEVLAELAAIAAAYRRRFLDREMHSEKALDDLPNLN
ncbi:MAG: DNA repair protein RecO [Lachnospiraceae bacterium]|jgi:DNA repair protein RecO (recombination protein O)|nr:DNA repair protein RecO [Lachnospiraceae bacterium]